MYNLEYKLIDGKKILIAAGYNKKLYSLFYSSLDGTKFYTSEQIIEKWNRFINIINLINELYNIDLTAEVVNG